MFIKETNRVNFTIIFNKDNHTCIYIYIYIYMHTKGVSRGIQTLFLKIVFKLS